MFKKKFLCTTLAFCTVLLPLTGCIETAFVAGAATGSAVVYDRRPVETIITDQKIYHDATLRLKNDDETNDNCHITVATFDKVVLMVGQAPNTYYRQRALDLIKSVPNIKRIYNEVQVSSPTTALARSNDTWITTKTKTEMLLTKNLHSSQIKVVTENGTVYLMGLVTPKQADDAVAVARHVTGVQRVVKIFEYVTQVD